MLAVVSHDAGGAEVVSSYVRRHSLQAVYVLEGPARNVFERKLGPLDVVSLGEALQQCSSVLCGTSWQSELEFRAIRSARERSKYSMAFLDHWVNYTDRFQRSGETCLPDEIWVGDDLAQAIAEREFPDQPVRLVDNPFLCDVREELAVIAQRSPSERGGLSVLYVCEPVSEHALRRYGDARYFGYTEEEAMQYFFLNLGVLDGTVERLTIRPHPSEPIHKYDRFLDEFALPFEIGRSRPLVGEIAVSDVVVGCESMAMVIGLLAGKRVMSCIPPGGRMCGLPQPAIEHLQRLLASRKTRPLGSDQAPARS